MQTVHRIQELRSLLDSARRDSATIGLVPTMGYFHDGHVSLIRAAAAECDIVVATIFVNPLQFAVGEDLEAYPRDHDGDSTAAAEGGCSVLFIPPPEEMYPDGRDAVATTVSVDELAEVMEGDSRPTHFAGVATVVAKLFFISGPCRAYFGEKDFQQLAILKQMAKDLSAPVDVIGCPVIREPDGLAMSSRNVYLTADEREAAPVLNEALRLGADLVAGGETNADLVRKTMGDHIRRGGLGELDYVEVANAVTLQSETVCSPESRLFGAVQFGEARLIDNVAVVGPKDSKGI